MKKISKLVKRLGEEHRAKLKAREKIQRLLPAAVDYAGKSIMAGSPASNFDIRTKFEYNAFRRKWKSKHKENLPDYSEAKYRRKIGQNEKFS